MNCFILNKSKIINLQKALQWAQVLVQNLPHNCIKYLQYIDQKMKNVGKHIKKNTECPNMFF